MKMGAEPKKVVWLVGLLAVAGAVYWMNSSDAPAPTTSTRPAVDPATAAAQAAAGLPKAEIRRTASGHAEGVGSWEPARPAAVDPSKVDPTLRLDLLTKVQSIAVDTGAHRNIFIREAAPPEPVVMAKNGPGGVIPNTTKIDVNKPPTPPAPVQPVAPAPPAGPPPAPPINLKYYGYSSKRSDGEKKAFFLDGEEIIVAAEGEIIKKQYKVVRISATAVQMEDTASKSTQTLPITPDAAPV